MDNSNWIPEGNLLGFKYYISDSPGYFDYNWNTYDECGWTDFDVSETEDITNVVIDYNWHTYYYTQGSFWLESPSGTSVQFASGQATGSYTMTVTDFYGEAMDGTWKLWIQDNDSDGGHFANMISVEFQYETADYPGVPLNPNPADGATEFALDGSLTWDFGGNTETYDLWFGPAGSMSEVVTGATANVGESYSPTLEPLTEYEWQVIAHNTNERLSTDGPVWNFYTDGLNCKYYPSDSPSYDEYYSNTYDECGWTDINVNETYDITNVVVDYTWDTDSYAYEGSFWLESPSGTSVQIASGESDGTFSHTLSDFYGEAMNGTWKLWIEDWGDGGHQASDITVEFQYGPVEPEDPTNPNPADGSTGFALDSTLTWDFGAYTETYDLWFGTVGNMSKVVTGATADASGNYSPILDYGTEYEWQVIEYNQEERLSTSGPIWSFYTQFNCDLTEFALSFDGTEEYAKINDNATLNMGGSSFTVEFWVQSTQNHSSEVIFVEYGTWEQGNYQVVSNNPNHLKVNFYGRSSAQGAEASNVNWADGEWHHIAGVLDNASNKIRLYMDGTLIAEENENNAPGNVTLPLYFASRGGTEKFSDMEIDEVRIWNDARTQSEIQNNMHIELTGSESNLVAYYKMNEGSGTSLSDNSSNSNNGTLYNMNDSNWIPRGNLLGYEYYPSDSPDFYNYGSNTYDECGWTDFYVSETDDIASVVVDYTWASLYDYEGSFWIESPIGNSVQIASWEENGIYGNYISNSSTLTDFCGEPMNGTWKLWIEDGSGTGNFHVKDITVEFKYIIDFPAGEPIDVGDGTTVNANANLNYAADQTIPEIPNGSFTPDNEFVLTGSGIVDITITTSSMYGAYYQGGIWNMEENDGGTIFFDGIDFDARGDVPIILGDDNPLPVTLSSFNATYNNEVLTIEWTTESEENNAGWNIYRGTAEDALQNDVVIQINDQLIAGAGTTNNITEYSYIDEQPIQAGETYWYWLEDVSTEGETAINSPTSVTIPIGDAPEIPLEYGLHQNYPNPFNPSTTISFILSTESMEKVEIEIFNVRGQKIRTYPVILSGVEGSASFHSIIWDGKDENGKAVSSGVYYYKLNAGKDSETKKMLLLK